MPETEEAPVATPPALLDRVPLVALRVVQFALDLAIVAVISVIPMTLALLLLPRNPDDSLGALLITIPVILALLVLAVIISWSYWAWLPRRRGGRTLVMGWLRLRVVRVDGGEAVGNQLTLRWLLLIVDAMFFGAVGLIAMLTSSRTQRIGDALADTLVVREAK